MYEYSIKLAEVYDGDTVIVHIDLGFDVWLHNQRVRLLGIDTPEIRTKNESEKALGIEAREFLRTLLNPYPLLEGYVPPELRLRCEKYDSSEKYGRILGDILIKPVDDGGAARGELLWISARDELLAYGRGREYRGGKR